MQTRRHFLAGLSSVGVASLVYRPTSLHAEPPPETTIVRLPQWKGSALCWAAPYFAEDLLRAEGFTEVRYVEADPNVDNSEWIARGQTDFDLNFPPKQIASIEHGVPIKVLSGLHSGCLELIAQNDIQSVADLRGKRVAVNGFNTSRHMWLAIMVAYVGLDPAKDIEWVTAEGETLTELFKEGKIDAFLASPPNPQQLREQNVGHTILANAVDRPWSQYFCCMIAGRSEFVANNPIATKRILRAIFKAADLCVSNPQMVVQKLVDRGFFPRYDYAFQTLNEIRYDRWRDYDPEDSLRFYALRMQEIGMIKSDPQKIIADGSDWRFLNELKRELKA